MKRNGCFTFQMIIDIAGAHGAISDAAYMDSPFIIIIYKKKVNRQLRKKIGNFN